MTLQLSDRRRHTRLHYHCPVKIYDPRTRRYRSGVTRNVSASGALIELSDPMHIIVGDHVNVAIDWSGTLPLMNHGDLAPVTVAHIDKDAAGVPLLAVRFAASPAMPMAA